MLTPSEKFIYTRRVAFSDTDAMGVVHHANYLRYLEEARVSWMREYGLSGTHYPKNDRVLAVLRYQVWHLKSSTFDDSLQVQLQVRREGLKIHFQYAIYKLAESTAPAGQRPAELVCEAETVHIPVDAALKPVRPSALLLERLEKESWTETWLSNS